MSDTIYLPAAQRMIIILHRAVNSYGRSSVQNAVRFLAPRVELCDFRAKMPDEWDRALFWWERKLDAHKKLAMKIQYKFAAKVR